MSERKSITIRQILDKINEDESVNYTLDDILDAEIYGCNMAGDEWGFELLGGSNEEITLMNNDYFRWGV